MIQVLHLKNNMRFSLPSGMYRFMSSAMGSAISPNRTRFPKGRRTSAQPNPSIPKS